MFKKILFATTASPTCDAAARVAFDLATQFDSELMIFHVFGVPTHGYSPFAVDVRTGEEVPVDPDYQGWVEEEMKNTYATFIEKNKKVSISTMVGQPYTEILKMARNKGADLIVMGSHARQEDVGAVRFRSIAGSTMQKVVKNARCPVLIVSRPCGTCFEYFSNVVFGTDLSSTSYYAFLFAFNIAKAIGARFYIFHALDINKDELGVLPSQEDIEAKILAARKKIEATYVPKMEGYKDYEISVWEGVPYVEVLKYSREKSGDLIVMAHHTREIDPDKTLLGATVEQVVLRSGCPVIVINRPGKDAKY